MIRPSIDRTKDRAPQGAWRRLEGLGRREDGGSLIEIAVLTPMMVLLVCYAIDFGYYFIVAANLTASARSSAEYSVQGFSSPSGGSLPTAGPIATAKTVAALAVGDLANVASSATATSVEVCSASVNTTGSTVKCTSYGQSVLSYTADADPEPTLFQCNRVDVVYTIRPPVPLSFFPNSWTPPTTFHRYVEMRSIN
jgi:Flp pilus assembly protein TadG